MFRFAACCLPGSIERFTQETGCEFAGDFRGCGSVFAQFPFLIYKGDHEVSNVRLESCISPWLNLCGIGGPFF
jgi:hypothetical protein